MHIQTKRIAILLIPLFLLSPLALSSTKAQSSVDSVRAPDPSFSRLETEESTGLGPAISRQFAQVLGGSINLSSTVGMGATFTVEIPVERGKITSAEPNIASTPQVIGLKPNQPQYRILVTDDNSLNRALLVDLLEGRLYHQRSGERFASLQAVELFKGWSPHLILMDMRMPVMDGYEASRRIKTSPRGQTTAIIAVTAGAFEEERATVLSAGCDDFVRKPFKQAALLDKIARRLGARYIYAAPDETEGNFDTSQGEALNATNLVVLPPEQLEELHYAVRRGEIKRTQRIIEQIRAAHPPLARSLDILLQNFDFETLITLTDKEVTWNYIL